MIDGVNKIVIKVEELGMFYIFESLQYHPDEVVYEKTIKLLENYFDTENTQEYFFCIILFFLSFSYMIFLHIKLKMTF